jgi:hypothetical protein
LVDWTESWLRARSVNPGKNPADPLDFELIRFSSSNSTEKRFLPSESKTKSNGFLEDSDQIQPLPNAQSSIQWNLETADFTWKIPILVEIQWILIVDFDQNQNPLDEVLPNGP